MIHYAVLLIPTQNSTTAYRFLVFNPNDDGSYNELLVDKARLSSQQIPIAAIKRPVGRSRR
jgi:hypothetical protein